MEGERKGEREGDNDKVGERETKMGEEKGMCCLGKSSLQTKPIRLAQSMGLATKVITYQTLSQATIEKRNEEDGVPCSNAISISFVEDLESLAS